MNRYNIALVPVDTNYSAQLLLNARKHFEFSSKDYLLGRDAIVHMTLCQFYADNDVAASEIADKALADAKNKIHPVTVDTLYFRPKPNTGNGFFSTGLLITKTRELEEMQSNLFDIIEEMGGKPITKSGSKFWPHFTMAYTNKIELSDNNFMDWAFGQVDTYPVLGLSDEHGQMKKIICSYE